MLRIVVLAFFFVHFQSVAESPLQEIELDEKTARQHSFSVHYEGNSYKNVFIVATFPDSVANNYTASYSIITIRLTSGNFVSFKDYVESREKSHKTEVAFENEKDFIDASVSIAYHCKTQEGLVCGGKNYTIESIRRWQSN